MMAAEPVHPHGHQCDLDLGHAHGGRGFYRLPSSFLPEDRKRLLCATILTGAMMMVEAVGGYVAGSLALISDAGHMLTHFFALTISLLALSFAATPPTDRKTFGFYRLEIFASLLNGLLLLLLTAWIFYTAYHRFITPHPISSTTMFFIALLGLFVNIFTVTILSGASRRSIAIKSAFLDLLGDTLFSGGVVLGAVVISVTGWLLIDPLLSIVLSLVILVWGYRLIRESVDIFLEATPKDVDLGKVTEAMKVVTEVKDVHDVHIWTLTSGVYALSAHVAVGDMALSDSSRLVRKINTILCDRFHIGHTAIQLECQRENDTGR